MSKRFILTETVGQRGYTIRWKHNLRAVKTIVPEIKDNEDNPGGGLECLYRTTKESLYSRAMAFMNSLEIIFNKYNRREIRNKKAKGWIGDHIIKELKGVVGNA